MGKNLTEITQKARAMVLWEAGHRTAKSMLRRGKIPIRSAERYIADFRKGLDWRRKNYPQRVKRKQTTPIVKKVIRQAQDRRRVHSLRQIAAKNQICPATARKILKDRGFVYSSINKRIRLTASKKKTRVTFAQKMSREDSIWQNVFFTDECSFWLGRSRPNKLWTQDAMEEEGGQYHGEKVHCWGGISACGALKLEVFEENLDSEGYLEILRSREEEMNNLYPEGWIFQQDGSGVHRSDLVTDYIDYNTIETINWPAYSPDLSPIENVWGWLKTQVNKDMPQTLDSLKRSIRNNWNRIDVEFLKPYFDSMPQRMEMVIRGQGAKINY